MSQIDNELKKAYEKIISAKSTHRMDPTGWRDSHLRPNWDKLFDFYNANNEKGLRIGCMPCYRKVLAFVKSKIVEINA